ncbi:MAG TPA: YafY family protein [Clostridia bacterium]|nr:YafY family protein [Clostridia bacterium]
MQINRLFEITYILMNKNTVTAKELAERFEVSQRTIYRDIDTLALAGVPVYTTKGKGGGISLLEDFVLNKSLLSEKEQTDILSALQGLNAMNCVDAEAVLKKLSSLFNKSTVSWLEVDFSDWGGQNGEIYRHVKTAILEKRVLEFSYYSTAGETTRRSIEPLQLWFKHRTWYVKGFCLLKHDVRMFRLTRMTNLLLTDEFFTKRILLEETPVQTEQKKEREINLKLKIAPEMAYRVYDEFSADLFIKNSDGSYTVSVTWPEDDWVYGFILSFGEYISVLEPDCVKVMLKEKLKKMMHTYL